jgi:hypothetical protein
MSFAPGIFKDESQNLPISVFWMRVENGRICTAPLSEKIFHH